MQGREASVADPKRDGDGAAIGLATRGANPIRIAGACAVGGGIVLTGFRPVVSATDLLEVAQHPERVLVAPAVLLALGAAGLSWLAPIQERIRVPDPIKLAWCLLLLGAALSTLGSDDQTASLLQVTSLIAAPTVLFLALLRSDLPVSVLCGSFLFVTLLLLLRADIIFFLDYGLPTGDALFDAKFTSEPYDFHYYGLQNPNHTAVFVLVALALTVFWACEPSLGDLTRRLLLAAAAVLFANIILLYVRSGVAVAVLLIGAALVALRPRPWRLGLAVAAVGSLLVLLALDGTTRDYFSVAFSADRDSTGVVRFESISRGVDAVAEEPVTGRGIGSYERSQWNPAHSSIIQAGAEMGVSGLAAVALFSGWLAWFGIRTARRLSWGGVAAGAGTGVAVYAAYTTVFGGVNAGLGNGLTPIWSLTVAMLLAVAVRATVRI